MEAHGLLGSGTVWKRMAVLALHAAECSDVESQSMDWLGSLGQAEQGSVRQRSAGQSRIGRVSNGESRIGSQGIDGSGSVRLGA